MSSPTTVIVGGGVIGLSTAYHLARKRAGRVVLIEQDTIGSGSSLRAAGITNSLMWTETGTRARQLGVEWFRRMSAELDGYTYHNEHGCLNLFAGHLPSGYENLFSLYDRLGAPYEVLDARQIRNRWSALRPPQDAVALWDPQGGYSEPDEYLPALAKRAAELGVEILEREAVDEVMIREGRVEGVRLGDRTIEADAVVSTVHAWSLPFWRPLGLQLPMKNFVHQRYVSGPCAAPLSSPPVNAHLYGGYVRPATGNRILLGVETMDRDEWTVGSSEFCMSEVTAPAVLRDQTVELFKEFLPPLADITWENEKVGLISFSSDGEPILGSVEELPGFYVGTAFHSGGFSYNTAAGLLLAEVVVDGKTSIDISEFSPDRFGRQETEEYLATTIPQSDVVLRRH